VEGIDTSYQETPLFSMKCLQGCQQLQNRHKTWAGRACRIVFSALIDTSWLSEFFTLLEGLVLYQLRRNSGW